MSMEPAALDAALAAAIGNDPALHAELRATFVTAARAHGEALGRAQTAVAWTAAAWRLHGLAASFGALGLMDCAADAGTAAAPDAMLLRRVRLALDALEG